jgi:hypothetical protein
MLEFIQHEAALFAADPLSRVFLYLSYIGLIWNLVAGRLIKVPETHASEEQVFRAVGLAVALGVFSGLVTKDASVLVLTYLLGAALLLLINSGRFFARKDWVIVCSLVVIAYHAGFSASVAPMHPGIGLLLVIPGGAFIAGAYFMVYAAAYEAVTGKKIMSEEKKVPAPKGMQLETTIDGNVKTTRWVKATDPSKP